MLNSLKSELINQFTLRSTFVYFILLAGSLFGPVVLLGVLDSTRFQPGETQSWDGLFDGFFIFLAIAVAFCASRTTADIKNRMTALAFVTQPGRWQSLLAKFLVLSGIVAAAFVTGTVLMSVAVMVFGGAVDTENLTRVWASLALAVTVSAVGVGFAAIVRNSIAAVAIPLVWLLVGESLVKMAGSVFDFFEIPARLLLTQNLTLITTGESVGMALAILLGWIVVFGALGFASNQMRDVR